MITLSASVFSGDKSLNYVSTPKQLRDSSIGIDSEVQRPFATVVVGEVISFNLLTLVVLPALYQILSGSPGWWAQPTHAAAV